MLNKMSLFTASLAVLEPGEGGEGGRAFGPSHIREVAQTQTSPKAVTHSVSITLTGLKRKTFFI